MAPTNNIVDRLPILSKVLKWFKGDQTVIDGPLFKLHYQVAALADPDIVKTDLCRPPPSSS